MHRPAQRSILDGVGPSAGERRNLGGSILNLVGLALLLAAAAIILFDHRIMSHRTEMAVEMLALAIGVAYGLFVASYTRSHHLRLERAYSAHLEELSQRLRTMAYRDALTGLYNHRYFYEQLSHEIDRSQRYGQPLSVLLMDMNNFKQINDTYGHMVGDKFLSLVGQVIASHIRSSDIGARYGGDEFVVILPNTSAAEARQTAEKLADAVANATTAGPGEERIRLGISVGTATCPEDSRSAGELLEIADARLYEVKTHLRSQHRRETA
jgi:diguanylate cyclase (GGDEF)-like protein